MLDTAIMQTLETASVGHPVTRDGVSLFPVYLHQSPGTLDYVAGIDALSSGKVRVEESNGGRVPELRVISELDQPVLMPEGDTFVGGLQNRTLNVTVLLAAAFNGLIPVSCVEAGRWANARAFSHGGSFASRRVRREKTRSVTDSVTHRRSRQSDQGAVWTSIDAELDRRGVQSPTRAFHDARSSLDASLAELAEMGPLPGQHGIVVSLGRRVVAADVFGRPDTLRSYWRPIVESLAFDAGQSSGRPSASAAIRFLRRVAHGSTTEAPGGDLGTEFRVRTPRLEAQGLRLNEALVHLSAFAA